MPTKTARSLVHHNKKVSYDESFCSRLLTYFDVPPFKITEVMKKDGSITLLETASELPTFAGFAKALGVTQQVLARWEKKYPSFREAADKARDLQYNILVQNSLRGNYSSSFAVFTAKNMLGWKDGKEESSCEPKTLCVRWESAK